MLTLPAATLAESPRGELLVKFKDGPSSVAAATGHAVVGAEVVRTFGEVGWQQVRLPKAMNLDQGIAAYNGLGTVGMVEPNSTSRPEQTAARKESVRDRALKASPPTSVVPNDPQYSSQWALRKMGATNAWAITTGSRDVVVAIIDSGVNYKHEDLRENMWRNPGETGLDAGGHDKATNGVDDDDNGHVDDVYGIDAVDNDSDPMDEGIDEPRFYHGTFTAGQIAAVGNNAKGICGMAWTAQVMAVRVIAPANSIRASDLLEGYDYVLKMKRRGVNIRVTNNSIGFAYPGEAIRDAMELAGREGILHVCAAGNAGVNMDYTSGYPRNFSLNSIIVVAASDESDQLLFNYGRTMVDLAAPGSNLRSLSGPKTNSYVTFNGAATSFSTPHVAGAAVLLLSADPTLSVNGLKAALLGSVDVLPSMRGKVMSNGRLNIGRALVNLQSNLPPIVIDTSPWVVRDANAARLTVTFSKPMNRASVESAWQLTPASAGRFEWEDEGRIVNFIPDQPLQTLTNYTGRVLASAKDLSDLFLDGNYDRASVGSALDDFQWTFRLPPANDDAYYAELINGPRGEVAGSNRNACKESAELDKAGNPGGASVWYRWVAPESGSVTFDTAGAAFDTLLAVGLRGGGDLDPKLTPAVPSFIAANNNFGALKTSRLSFFATEGAAYMIGVDGVNVFGRIPEAQTGQFTLHWYPTPQSLTFRRLTPGRIVLSWSTNALGYRLESSETLGAEAAWTEVQDPPIISGATKVVTLNLDGSGKLYRLRKP